MIEGQLRHYIRQQKASSYQIAKLAEVDQATMSRFMAGKSTSLVNINKLCRLLGCNLTAPKHTIPIATRGRPRS